MRCPECGSEVINFMPDKCRCLVCDHEWTTWDEEEEE